MKNLLFILTLFLFSCAQNINKTATKLIKNQKVECTFDLNTQTDKFLKQNPKINGYTWTDSIHSGFIILDNSDTIKINRGGCNHFNFFCELTSKNIDTLTFNNEKFGLRKAIELVNLIFPKSDAELLERLIKTTDCDTEYVGGGYLGIYKINRVFNYDDHCSTTLVIERLPNGYYKLEIGYYLC